MDWKMHFLFAFFLFLIIGGFILDISNILELFFLSFICGLFSLLPDLDYGLSKSRQILDRLVPISAFILSFLYFNDILNSIYSTLIISGLYFILFTFLKPKHRGITHSIFFLLLLSLIAYYFDKTLGIAFFIGYSSHLISDCTLKLI